MQPPSTAPSDKLSIAKRALVDVVGAIPQLPPVCGALRVGMPREEACGIDPAQCATGGRFVRSSDEIVNRCNIIVGLRDGREVVTSLYVRLKPAGQPAALIALWGPPTAEGVWVDDNAGVVLGYDGPSSMDMNLGRLVIERTAPVNLRPLAPAGLNDDALRGRWFHQDADGQATYTFGPRDRCEVATVGINGVRTLESAAYRLEGNVIHLRMNGGDRSLDAALLADGRLLITLAGRSFVFVRDK